MSARSLSKARLIAAVALLCIAPGFHFGCTAPEDARPNVVLVILDTVRRDATGLGDPRPDFQQLTPVFDRLAAEGLAFTRAFANSPWTVPSHASFFTGRLPSDHGCTSVDPQLSARYPTAAELLTEAGYATAAFYSNPWLADRTTGLLRGFEERIEARIGRLDQMVSHSGDQGGQETLRNIDQWLRNHTGEAPFFLFVNFLEAHLPYDPPEDFRRERLPQTPLSARISIEFGHQYNAGLQSDELVNWDLVRGLYAGDVLSADRLLGRLLAMLTGRGIMENTVIIVASDHGENLGDHGLMDHQYSVQETLLGVPLAIRGPPAYVARAVRRDPVMLTDLFATILALAEVSAPAENTVSRNLLAEPAPALRPLMAEYAGPGPGLLGLLQRKNPALDVAPLAPARRTIRVGDLRLSLGSDGSVELHDLAADPHQARNLAAERPADVERLRALMSAPERVPAADTELDSVTREQLRSLGYIR